MPEAITESIHATTVVSRQYLTGLIDVRDVGERLACQVAVANGSNAGPAVKMGVEAPGEVEWFGVFEWLIAEDEHGVLVHSLANCGERFGLLDPAKVDGADLGDEV